MWNLCKNFCFDYNTRIRSRIAQNIVTTRKKFPNCWLSYVSFSLHSTAPKSNKITSLLAQMQILDERSFWSNLGKSFGSDSLGPTLEFDLGLPNSVLFINTFFIILYCPQMLQNHKPTRWKVVSINSERKFRLWSFWTNVTVFPEFFQATRKIFPKFLLAPSL